MTTMLEKVARAINPEAFAKMDKRRLDFPADPRSRFLEEWPVCDVMNQARAALQAIREPSHDVTKTAGQRALISLDQEQLAEAFTAMIDTILAEDKA